MNTNINNIIFRLTALPCSKLRNDHIERAKWLRVKITGLEPVVNLTDELDKLEKFIENYKVTKG